MAAAAEKGSEHPVGRAVVSEAVNRSMILADPEAFEAVSGMGVMARVSGRKVMAGRLAWFSDQGRDVSSLSEPAARFQSQGKTVLAVFVDGLAWGLISVADRLKPETPAVIKKLKAYGLKVAMLTGDNPQTAAGSRSRPASTGSWPSIRPDEKADAIRKLQEGGSKGGHGRGRHQRRAGPGTGGRGHRHRHRHRRGHGGRRHHSLRRQPGRRCPGPGSSAGKP